MMKGEFFAPPPKPQQPTKRTYKKVMISAKTLSDMLPQDSFSHQSAGGFDQPASKESEEGEAPVCAGDQPAQEGASVQTTPVAKKDDTKPQVSLHQDFEHCASLVLVLVTNFVPCKHKVI